MTFEEKRAKIKEIEGQIESLTRQLQELIDPTPKGKVGKKKSDWPSDFSLRESVFSIYRERGTSGRASKEEVVQIIKGKGVNVTPDQVQGALSNLKADGKLDIVSRGVYALKA